MPRYASFLTLALSLCMASCAGTPSVGSGDDSGDGDGDGSGEGVGQGHQAIDEYVESIPDLVLPDAQQKTEVDCGDSCPPDAQEGDNYCVYHHYTETAHYEKFVAFQPNSATLWPGLVVRGADAEEGLLTPVGVELAPVTFSVSLENIANSPVGHMEKPSLSAFRDARNDILEGGVTGATAAALDFDVIELHSQSQIATALGGGVNWPGGAEIAASFDFTASDKKTKILVNFTQAYYTIDVDSPTTPKDFFAPEVTVDDLKPFASPESPPLYIQSITYGRRVIFSVESNEQAEDIKAALEATYKGAFDVNVKVSDEHQQMLQSSTIQAFVIGGAGGEATGAISGFDGLITFIKSGGDYSKDSPGAPIAYKLSYLDNEVTKLAFTTEFSDRECTKNQGDMRVDLVSLDHLSGGDVGGGNMEFYGYVAVRYPTPQSGVTSCDAGGQLVDLWRLDSSSWIEVPEYSTWKPSAPVYLDLNKVPMTPEQGLCLDAHIWESDSFGDDDFGGTQLLLTFENGWDGDHVLHLHGSGSDAVDISVGITVE